MGGTRKTFAVGKLTARATEIRLVEVRRPPLAGPFGLRAVVRSA